MDQQQRQLIKKYLDIILRRKKVIVFFLLLGLAGGLGQYLSTPKVYKCTSLIKYQKQRINPTAMSPDDIRSRTQEAVATISQQITSRSSLENMIKEFDLYLGMRTSLPMEDVVDVMRNKHIEIGQQGKGDIFEVSYQGKNPKKVLLVTNALAAKFIEENLRFREERASETSAYIQDELKMAKAGLDKKEAIMRDYKLKYYNEMPEQRQNNMNRLNALQDQYQNNQSSIHDLERTKIMVQEQISLREELLAQQLSGVDNGEEVAAVNRTERGESEIIRLRRELQALEARYTGKHPQVKRIKKTLQELEAKRAGIAADEDSGEEGAEDQMARHGFLDLQTEQLKNQLQDMEYSIARLKKDREEIEKQIKKFQSWVEAAPVREAEWAALTRDYEQLNEHYQALVAQSLQAESAYSLEKQQKGSQFKIVDSAHLPEKPFKPDFRKIMLMAIGLGLGVGGGLALGLDLLNTSFKEPDDLEAYLNVAVVCAIPSILTKKEERKKKIWQALLWAVLVILLVVIGGAFAYFWKQGMIIL
ncbi:MAG: hypothetical protein KQH63_15975 [Desulfobulbaceae bacterium]|nr:hypothetical protein [Desulfobulbaceae bacterium]